MANDRHRPIPIKEKAEQAAKEQSKPAGGFDYNLLRAMAGLGTSQPLAKQMFQMFVLQPVANLLGSWITGQIETVRARGDLTNNDAVFRKIQNGGAEWLNKHPEWIPWAQDNQVIPQGFQAQKVGDGAWTLVPVAQNQQTPQQAAPADNPAVNAALQQQMPSTFNPNGQTPPQTFESPTVKNLVDELTGNRQLGEMLGQGDNALTPNQNYLGETLSGFIGKVPDATATLANTEGLGNLLGGQDIFAKTAGVDDEWLRRMLDGWRR